MKTILILLSAILMIACSNPQKFIQKDNPQRAFEVSLRKCQNGKLKARNLEALEASYELLMIEDAEEVNHLVGQEEPSVWPKVFWVAKRIEKRQRQVKAIARRAQKEQVYLDLRHYPVEGLLEEASEKAASYFYNEANRLVDYARQGDRIAAREAHQLLLSINDYRPNYKDSERLAEEMFELGTTHVLLNPTTAGIQPNMADRLFSALFWRKTFPHRKGWTYFMLHPESEKKPHYEVDVSFSGLYVSGNDTSVSTCSAEKEVEDGYIEKQVWSESDSVYVTVKEKKFKTVSATVTTTQQSKSAQLDLNMDIWDVNNRIITLSDAWRGWESWSNEFSTVCGDKRALEGNCDDTGGFHASFPTGNELLRDAAANLRRKFFKQIDRLD